MTTNRRPPLYKRKLINHAPIQFALLFYALFIGFLIAGVNYIALRYLGPDETLFGMPYGIYLLSAATFTAAILGHMLLSNQIVGPIMRLSQHISEAANGGPLNRVKFRDSDQFHDLAKQYNLLLDRFDGGKKPE